MKKIKISKKKSNIKEVGSSIIDIERQTKTYQKYNEESNEVTSAKILTRLPPYDGKLLFQNCEELKKVPLLASLKEKCIYFKKYYDCMCNMETIAIEKFDDDSICLAFFQRGLNNSKLFTWKQKTNAIWQILTKGTLYADMVYLSPAKAKELGKDLIELTKEKK
jgi:hypothetical protein